MLITAKFPSRCAECQRAIHTGDRIEWVKGVKTVKHAACSAAGKQVAEAVQTSRAEALPVDTSLVLPVPEGLDYLPYQQAGIAYAMGRSSTLIADEMGLGKTIQAIGVINADPTIRRVLVVCPASLKLNWQRELGKWLTRDPDVQVINYDILDRLPEDGTWDLLIADECHYAKNPKAKRTKLLQDIGKRCTRKILLTGTPILNKPIELWPILQMLDASAWDPAGTVKGKHVGPGEGAGFFRFAMRYCNAHKVQVSRFKTVWDFSGASNLDGLQEKLRSTCMVRRLKTDVLKDLPPKRRQIVPIAYSGEDIDEDWGDDLEENVRRASVRFEDISRVRHVQAVAKIDPAIEYVSTLLDSVGKVIVFAHHHDVINALCEGLASFGAVKLDGTMSAEMRDASVQAFQHGMARVFVGSLKAAGVGLTLTAASTVVFVESDWTPATMTQAEDRAHRIGQDESVSIHVLVCAGTLDERMLELVQAKQMVADLALDTPAVYGGEGREIAPEQGRANHTRSVSELPALSQEEIESIHADLRELASVCDGARQRDGVGFNGVDSAFGKALAGQVRLSIRQALAAKKMLVKYRRQLGR